jgi:hypothetical protein
VAGLEVVSSVMQGELGAYLAITTDILLAFGLLTITDFSRELPSAMHADLALLIGTMGTMEAFYASLLESTAILNQETTPG